MDSSRPRLIVHTLAQAEAALTAAAELGLSITLQSPPEGVRSLGALYFREMIAAARMAGPGARCRAVLDCGSAPGLALAALRLGAEAVRLQAEGAVFAAVSDIAGQLGREIERGCGKALGLDLGTTHDPLAKAREYLSLQTA